MRNTVSNARVTHYFHINSRPTTEYKKRHTLQKKNNKIEKKKSRFYVKEKKNEDKN